jgi:protein-S-isoprenylcysteine O-methyltransferase Ste14
MIALKTLIFTIFVPGTVAFVLPWLILGQAPSGEVLSPTPWLLGLLPLLIGVGLYLWCAGAFTFVGKGTPAPIDAPIFLVRSGPYQWVRNPMYLGVLAIIVGQAILLPSVALVGYALVVWLIVHLFVVSVEEPSLRRHFGASYEAYLRAVPRWLPRPPQQDQLAQGLFAVRREERGKWRADDDDLTTWQ